jgi:hypothetical protein
MCLAMTNGGYVIKNITQNGLLYEEVAEIKFYNSFWRLVTYLDTEDQTEKLDDIKFLIDKINHVCENTNKTTNLCKNFQHMFAGTYDQMVMQNAIIFETKIPTEEKTVQNRNKRDSGGLINIVGKASKFLFGTLDNEDGEKFEHEIEKLKKSELKSRIISETQTSFLKNTLSDLNSTFETINANTVKTEININQIKSDLNKLKIYIDLEQDQLVEKEKLEELISLTSFLILNFRQQQQLLIDIVVATQFHFIHPYLFSPRKLLKELEGLSKIIPNDVELPLIPNQENIHTYFKIFKS